MDSGNSGSMQSSSGGEEEYDSRSDSISAYINSSGTTPPPTQHHHNNQSLFDPLSNFLDAFPRSPAPPTMNSVLNLEAAWNRGQPTGANCADMGRGLMGPSPISISDRDPFPMISNSSSISPPSMQFPAGGSENGGGRGPASVDHQQNVSRNPKKRSRASRRAPTTVLTTDTSNFRAMVQEFTGIPAPPFSSSPFPRARGLDLFNSASSMRSALSNSYLLRPFAQKLQQLPPQVPTSIFASQLPLTTTTTDAVSNSSTDTASIINATSSIPSTTAAGTNTFQLPSDLGLLKQHSNLLNPSFTFQSPAPPKYPFSSVPAVAVGAKTQTIPSTGSHLRMGLLPLDVDGNFGVNQARGVRVDTLTGLVGSDAMQLRTNDPPSWGDHGLCSHFSNSQRVTSCKMNYNTGPSPEFHADKGSENVSSRGEGMVDSWICSTD